jgi:hypothetical protein
MTKKQVQKRLNESQDMLDFYDSLTGEEQSELKFGWVDYYGEFSDNPATATFNQGGCFNQAILCRDGIVRH